jgi:hypothetical protein
VTATQRDVWQGVTAAVADLGGMRLGITVVLVELH